MRATKRLGVRTTWSFLLRLVAVPMITVAFAPALTSSPLVVAFSCRAATSSSMSEATIPTTSLSSTSSPETIFEEFVQFILEHQSSMIHEIEQIDGSGASFSLDGWGAFKNGDDNGDIIQQKMSGGITRVLQGGNVVEKGACSLTIIRDGVLSVERAKTISGRNNHDRGVNEADNNHEPIVQAGDMYSAAALSVVLHTRNPFVPTFRSDVRIFLVKSSNDSSLGSSVAWFGGGSDLTPYYLIDNDIVEFHTHLKELCDRHNSIANNYNLSYHKLKRSCDEYFYLPARAEHRGTGGIFFDDVSSSPSTLEFVMDVARGWMPSWLPIVTRNRDRKYTPEEKHWQCLRRGRYLEFNLLYDRGVRFGLVNENPRVEGVMVSAPPIIAYDYNHVPTSGSEEERLIKILKKPIDWVE